MFFWSQIIFNMKIILLTYSMHLHCLLIPCHNPILLPFVLYIKWGCKMYCLLQGLVWDLHEIMHIKHNPYCRIMVKNGRYYYYNCYCQCYVVIGALAACRFERNTIKPCWQTSFKFMASFQSPPWLLKFALKIPGHDSF